MSTYRVRYQTIEFGDTDIHMQTLRDNQQFSDDDNEALDLGISSATWPLFGQLWPSGQVLAHHMVDFEIKGKRILEVGCGLALSSHVLNDRDADITATDYHPEVETFLNNNVDLNGGKEIPFVRTGWEDKMTDIGTFDLIIGSDLLYEQDHALLLATFIERHSNTHCQVIVVDPGRGNSGKFTQKMRNLGYEHTFSKPLETEYLDKPFTGKILLYKR